jgi:hypothetical protein
MELSEKAHALVKDPTELQTFLAEHPEVNVDLLKRGTEDETLLYYAAYLGETASVKLLLDHKADINAQDEDGITPCMIAYITSDSDDDETALVLLERGADIHIRDTIDRDTLHYTLQYADECMRFILLCCGADTGNILQDDYVVTQAKVDAAIDEYKHTQAYIEQYHELLEQTLSTGVEVDTRMGLRSTGIYQEPLERTLEYLGLSMNPDQVVNTSIDGTTPMRVLIPSQHRNAKHWYEKYVAWENTRTHKQPEAWGTLNRE